MYKPRSAAERGNDSNVAFLQDIPFVAPLPGDAPPPPPPPTPPPAASSPVKAPRKRRAAAAAEPSVEAANDALEALNATLELLTASGDVVERRTRFAGTLDTLDDTRDAAALAHARVVNRSCDLAVVAGYDTEHLSVRRQLRAIGSSAAEPNLRAAAAAASPCIKKNAKALRDFIVLLEPEPVPAGMSLSKSMVGVYSSRIGIAYSPRTGEYAAFRSAYCDAASDMTTDAASGGVLVHQLLPATSLYRTRVFAPLLPKAAERNDAVRAIEQAQNKLRAVLYFALDCGGGGGVCAARVSFDMCRVPTLIYKAFRKAPRQPAASKKSAAAAAASHQQHGKADEEHGETDEEEEEEEHGKTDKEEEHGKADEEKEEHGKAGDEEEEHGKAGEEEEEEKSKKSAKQAAEELVLASTGFSAEAAADNKRGRKRKMTSEQIVLEGLRALLARLDAAAAAQNE